MNQARQIAEIERSDIVVASALGPDGLLAIGIQVAIELPFVDAEARAQPHQRRAQQSAQQNRQQDSPDLTQ